MRLRIEIDQQLLRRATRLTGIKSTRELVQRGLQILVQLSEVEIGVEEARSRAKRLVKRNKNLFRRLA